MANLVELGKAFPRLGGTGPQEGGLEGGELPAGLTAGGLLGEQLQFAQGQVPRLVWGQPGGKGGAEEPAAELDRLRSSAVASARSIARSAVLPCTWLSSWVCRVQ